MRPVSYEPAHCIVCGHTESIEIADADQIKAEVEALWAFHEKRLKPGTPMQRLRDRVSFSQHAPLRLVACVECGLVYRNPTERAFEVEASYSRDCPPREMLQALHDTQVGSYRSQARRLRAMLAPGAAVLEVGSYVGAFLVAAREAGLNSRGVDINPAVNGFARSFGFHVDDGELADSDSAPVDAIAIWNTFDQLADPRAVVAAARNRLRAGGVLAIRVPNGAFYRRWAARSDPRARSLLALNNLLTFPYRWGFNPASLSALLRSAGFDTVELVGDVLVPTADGWTRWWARIEERVVKRVLRGVQGPVADAAPWFELYATATAKAA